MPDLGTFLTWATLGVHAIVVFLIFSRGHFRTYPWFSFLVLYLAITGLLNTAIMYLAGYQSPIYYYSFYGTMALRPFLRIATLWRLLQGFQLEQPLRRSDFYFLTVLALLLCVPLYSAVFRFQGADRFATYFAVVTPMELVAFVLCTRLFLRLRTDYVLGRNLAGILMGMGLMILAQTIRMERAFVVQASELFFFLGQFSNFLAFSIWAVDLWERDPPRLRDSVRVLN